ncbi:MAG: hypothetical protein EHM64_05205 [Ignavibacteriae bacterium]|nr:MAG: hypothetical protein EHM64_05205 [Ignavibacteriota bacterium]
MNKLKPFVVMTAFSFIALSLVLELAQAQSRFYTKRASNELRKGPANYYPLVGIVPQNTALLGITSDDGWTQVQLDNELIKQLETDLTSAWISKNCLIDKPAEQKSKQLKITTKVATPSSVAAAIRGFAVRFKRTTIKNVDALLKKDLPCFTHEEYQAFVRESGLKQREVHDRKIREKYTALFRDYDVSVTESMIGFNIASEISSRGVVEDPSLHQYVNLLGTLILQRSNAYDTYFRIFILDSSKPEAFSTPGGITFISLGLIRACTSEAELGAVIAHEFVHSILHQGMSEIRERAQKIRAEEGFAELDAAAGHVADSTETDLEEYMQEAYDSVVKPRLLGYEKDADRGAVVFLVQAGYDPNAVASVINRISTLLPQAENDLDDNPFQQRDYKARALSATSFIQEYFPQTQGVLNTLRFERNCGSRK